MTVQKTQKNWQNILELISQCGMYAEDNVNIQNTIAFLNTRTELKTEYHLQ